MNFQMMQRIWNSVSGYFCSHASWFCNQAEAITVNIVSSIFFTIIFGGGGLLSYRWLSFSSRTSGLWEGKLFPYRENQIDADKWIVVKLALVTRSTGCGAGYIQSNRYEHINGGPAEVLVAVDEISERDSKFPKFRSRSTFEIVLVPSYAFRKNTKGVWVSVLQRQQFVISCKLANPYSDKTTLTVEAKLDFDEHTEAIFKGSLTKHN